MPTPVELYRYDLSGGAARSMAPMLIGRPLEGVWHTSMVAYGKEYYFDGGVGIVCEPAPGTTRFGKPLRKELLGETAKTEAEFAAWVAAQLRSTFGPNDYHLLERNCNHFTQAASRFLLDTDIPSDVRDMIPTLLNTPLGMMLRPMLENMIGAPPTRGVLQSHSPGPGLRHTDKTSFTPDEEEEFNLAKAMLESNELLDDGRSAAGVKVTLAALDTLKNVFRRVLANPSGSKVRGLSTNSNTYTSNILPLEEYGAEMILRLAGFRRLPHPTGDGDQWLLSEADMRLPILEHLVRGLDEVASEVVSSADRLLIGPRTQLAASYNEKDLLVYSSLPIAAGYKPLGLGMEGTNTIVSITVMSYGTTRAFGKGQLVEDYSRAERLYYIMGESEQSFYGACEVLCLREGADAAVVWVPAALAYAHATAENDFIYRASGQYGVCRSEKGNSMTPGMMEPTGACVVPYGGKAVTVTDTAEVLCITARVPDAVMKQVEALREGEQIRVNIGKQNGVPIDSFRDLLEWEPPTGAPLPVPAVAPRSGVSDARGPRLMVCHDMRGGYQPCDNGYYSADDDGKLNGAYTVSYWRYVDDFVYFSHHRVTVPPHEWIAAAHRHGSTALGTLITEGDDGSADLYLLLTNADMRSRIIARLVYLCVYYGFDGYLINIEVNSDASLMPTLIVFLHELRQSIITARGMGVVIWYDAITVRGYVSYQNALTEQNKPFFDVSDSIMTNYWWYEDSLQRSYTLAGDRFRDVYVGVDVFGRGQYGGGQFNTDVAVRAIADAKLSVGMFAPGWTLEMTSGGSRNRFLEADSHLWSSVQPFLRPHTLSHTVTDLPLWSCFSSGIGSAYFVNGAAVSPSSIYCQLGAAHRTPPFEYIANSADTCQLQSPITATGPVGSWRQDAVWHGDRSLSFTIAPLDAVTIWEDHVSKLSTGEVLLVDIALRGGEGVPAIRVDYLLGGEVPYETMINSSEADVVYTGADEWRVLRYVLPAVHGDGYFFNVHRVSMFNESSNAGLPCVLGGVALRIPEIDSPLICRYPCSWSSSHIKSYNTVQSTRNVLRLDHISENVNPAAGATEATIAVVVSLSVGGVTTALYCGQHRVSVSDADAVLDITYAATAPADAVSAVEYYTISSGL